MVRTQQPSELTFGSISSRDGDLKLKNYEAVFYIGLGDQFDDDRRLVRRSEALSEDKRNTRPVHAPRAVTGVR